MIPQIHATSICPSDGTLFDAAVSADVMIVHGPLSRATYLEGIWGSYLLLLISRGFQLLKALLFNWLSFSILFSITSFSCVDAYRINRSPWIYGNRLQAATKIMARYY